MAQVSPVLAALFDPPRAATRDLAAESPLADLDHAQLDVIDGVLTGTVAGSALLQTGASFLVDTRGGPAPDVQVWAGQRWLRVADVDDWKAGKQRIADGHSEVVDGLLHLAFDLRQSGRWEDGHAGTITAMVGTFDHQVSDPGPGGVFGDPVDARVVLTALAANPNAKVDPDLTAAVALGFGGLYALVAPEVRPTVLKDAADWLDYGLSIDPWLAEQGATWRLRSLPPMGKLLWAWPAGQSATYGAVPLGRVEGSLSAEAWRFLVPDVETLRAYRDTVRIWPELAITADLADRAIWDQLRYRATDEAMQAWCASEAIDVYICRTWAADVRSALTLGTVDGMPIPMHDGVSASQQLKVYRRHRQYIGDCVTATTLTMTTLQAIGVAPLALGWNGDTYDAPTHDVPLFLDGDHFFAPQSAPGRSRVSSHAWIYVHLPVLQPWRTLGLGWEPGGGVRGGAVAGGRMPWANLTRELQQGLPLDTVGRWVTEGAGGGWPGW